MNVGIIGCGKIAQVRHAPECASNPSITIAGFFDRVDGRAQAMSTQYGGRVYANYEEMLRDPDVDAVIVCTANVTHAEISISALRAGKHVLCEKPISVSVEEAEDIQREAEHSGRLLMVAHNQRFDHVNRKAKQLIQSGAIGDIISFHSEFSHGGPEQWSIDAANSMYIRKNEAFLGALGDVGIHKIDLMRWMLEDEITEVRASVKTLQKKDSSQRPLEVEDNAVLLVMTQKGYQGTVYASWTNYGRCESSADIYGTAGTMHISDSVSDSVIVIQRAGGCT
ncbi:MAG: Gfo/Idh/MocA family protein, partial [Acetanaerobacterium sp.]